MTISRISLPDGVVPDGVAALAFGVTAVLAAFALTAVFDLTTVLTFDGVGVGQIPPVNAEPALEWPTLPKKISNPNRPNEETTINLTRFFIIM